MNEAPFYLDLLQLCGGLLFGDDGWFQDRNEIKYGGTSQELGRHCVVGIQHAASLLSEIDTDDGRLPPELLQQLAINPLVIHLQVPIERLEKETMLQAALAAVPEGSVVPSTLHYLQFDASNLLMAIAALAMDRIISWQSHIATDTLESRERLRTKLGGELPMLVNMGSMRQYTTTLAAYFACARHVAGVERFVDEHLRKKSRDFDVPVGKTDWQLKSHDVVARVTDEAHRTAMSTVYGTNTAMRLIADGIYYLADADYLNYELKGFVLDGEVANSFRLDGKLAYSTSGGSKIESTSGFLVDSAYQAIWSAFPVADLTGVYGSRGRDLVPSLAPYADRPVARAKWSRIPKILIDDVSELHEIVARVGEGFPEKQIFFRGQGQHHATRRSAETKQWLYGDPGIDELSLPTAASRHAFEFDSFIAVFQLQLQGLLYSRYDRSKFAETREDLEAWGPVSAFADNDVADMYEKWFKLFYSYEWDLLAMGLAQHYGIPTHGLDVTDDLSIALWFALHQWFDWKSGSDTKCWYKPAERGPKSGLEKHPVIYILATNDDVKRDLDQVEYAELTALRPERQRAYLHYGGWGFHTNICAEDVVAAVFLSERFEAPELPPAEWLFPDERTDTTYGELIELKRRAIVAGLEWGYSWIAEYRAW